MSEQLYFVFDVESIGLHGEAFAVAWVVVDATGKEHAQGCLSIDRLFAVGAKRDREWVNENVPEIEETNKSAIRMRDLFWEAWMEWKNRGALMVADCCWPVEANYLSRCIADVDGERNWTGPYPLIDVSSIALAKGIDPLKTWPRLPSEEPAHHPLNDARQSARILLELLHPSPHADRSEAG